MFKDILLLSMTQHKASHEESAPCNMQEKFKFQLGCFVWFGLFQCLDFLQRFLDQFYRFSSRFKSNTCHHLLIHSPSHGSHHSPPEQPWHCTSEEALCTMFQIDVCYGL